MVVETRYRGVTLKMSTVEAEEFIQMLRMNHGKDNKRMADEIEVELDSLYKKYHDEKAWVVDHFLKENNHWIKRFGLSISKFIREETHKKKF